MRERDARYSRDNDEEQRQIARDSARRVVARLREALGVTRDVDVGPALGRQESAAGNWVWRGSVPREACEMAAQISGRSLAWIVTGRETADDAAPDDSSTAGDADSVPSVEDPRLDAITSWWVDWWASASEEERTWALVQLRRAIPECAEPIRRRIDVAGKRRRNAHDGDDD